MCSSKGCAAVNLRLRHKLPPILALAYAGYGTTGKKTLSGSVDVSAAIWANIRPIIAYSSVKLILHRTDALLGNGSVTVSTPELSHTTKMSLGIRRCRRIAARNTTCAQCDSRHNKATGGSNSSSQP